MEEVKPGFESWAIVEVMGHSVYAGFATDASIGGQSYLRVDVPANGENQPFTKFLGPGSIFSITPTDEETARLFIKSRDMAPFDTWTIRKEFQKLTQVETLAPPPMQMRSGPNDLEDDDYVDMDEEVYG